MNCFKTLPIDIVREIIVKTETLEQIAKARRTCRLFLTATKLFGKDLFEIAYQKELGGFIQSSNMVAYLFQGFYYNFFPAVRHAVKNGIDIDHTYIDVERDARDRSYNSKYLEGRLEMWTRVVKHYQIRGEHVKFVAQRAWTELINHVSNFKLCDFYLSLFELFLKQNLKVKNDQNIFFLIYEEKSMSKELKARIKRFKELMMNLM